MIHWDMLKKPAPEQTALEMVTLDSLVPKDHLLRKIDAVIDFSFIHDRVAGLYCADNGRPPLDSRCNGSEFTRKRALLWMSSHPLMWVNACSTVRGIYFGWMPTS